MIKSLAISGGGNSDASLTMFGRNVTPNAHALADEFVLLDNTYCNGEVSEDGHQWCNGAYADDFVERAYVNSYSGRGEPDSDGLADSPAGYLWDNCRKHGKSYRSYGEFASFTSDPDSPPKFDGIKGLEGHASLAWSNFQTWWRLRPRLQEDSGLHRRTSRGGKDRPVEQLYGHCRWGKTIRADLPPENTPHLPALDQNDLALGDMIQAISHSLVLEGHGHLHY